MLSNGKANTFSALSALLSVAILLIVAPATSLATDVSLAWDPSPDPDLAGYRIYYQANSVAVPFQGTGAFEGNAPVDGRNSTTATISGLDPANSYYFAVTAYNSSGAESVYSNIVSVPETLPPTVSITSPANNDAVSGTVSVTASATDNAGIARVQFLVNGVPVFETAKAPYSFAWNVASLAKGSYDLAARAVDISGNEAVSKAVTVSVPGDVISPTVSLVTPSPATAVGGTVSISASAKDDVGVARLELYLDGTSVYSGAQNSVSFDFNSTLAANGSHIVSARAYDAAGNIGSASATFSVYNAVKLTDPTPPATVSAPLTIADAQLALQIASSQVVPGSEELLRLDLAPYVNGTSQPNGRIDTGDIVVILSLLTGKI
ncbi:Ig-like domain-containing protein [Geomonas ferrireducens]|uniref:Ig-like domain-containing protein n=1 Tax=Geomonas ferrireducens TaxID=2570227 RepID=UPI0010A7D49E|nr:Ig-like domain-containing protein [Geomonas ferrireducens]